MTARTMSNPIRTIALAVLGILLGSTVVQAQAQTTVITGKVLSEVGQPLASANVYITEMAISVAADAAGVYSITIPAARVSGQMVNLRARAIGYQPTLAQMTLRLGNQTHDFSLKRDINRLNEVTVTGSIEGTERVKVPFAVARLTAEELPVPSLDPMRTLAGKVPGLRIAQTSGQPGANPEIQLRSPTSINAVGRSQGPLIIVDGAIMRVGNLNEIGALDIESVEIVKGAAGASLYGTTAANGVIIVKTKRGNSRDGVSWNFRSEFGVSDLSSVNLDPPVFHQLQLDETGQRFCVAGSSNVAPCSRTINWMSEIYRINNVNADTVRTPQTVQWNAMGSGGELLNTFQANPWPGVRYDGFAQVSTANPLLVNSVDASGRVGNVRYFVSGSATDDQGAIKGLNGQQQRRARVNLDYDIRQDWRLSVSTLYDQGTTDNRSGGSSNGGIFGQLLRGAPGGTNYLATDTLGRRIVRGGGAPLRGSGNGAGSFLYDNGALADVSKSNRYLATIATTYTPFEWATFEGSVSFDNRHRINDFYQRKGYRTFTLSTSQNFGQQSVGNADAQSTSANLSATFRKDITSDLTAKGTVRAVYERTDARSDGASGQQFVVEDVYTLSNTSTNFAVSSSFSSVRTMGMLTGVNLDYKDRYIFDATFRYDGSSLFGAGNRWAPFGRLSAVWIASEEPFWNVPGINEFRIRASRGTAGNTPNFSAQYETYSCAATGCSLGQAGNSKLKPETTTETEVGVDFTVLDRVGVEVTRVESQTVDQILQVPTPSSLGFSTQWRNAGTLHSRTLEVAMNLPVVTTSSLQWDVRASYDRSLSRISKLNMPEYFTNAGLGNGNGSFFLISSRTEDDHGFPINQIGNIWGRAFYRSCKQLPSSVRASCGAGKDYQLDDRGFVVWTGAGNTPMDGITRNLWQTKLPAAQSPWNYPLSFGHPIVDRPLRGERGEGVGRLQVLGNTLPDFRMGLTNTVTWKKFTLYALLDGTFGHDINNQAEGWGIFDFNARSMDQGRGTGTTVETAKPVGYSWRAGGSEGAGSGGLYDILGPNTYNVEDGSYVKLREFNLSYRLGPIAGNGDWTLALLGRNLLTWTKYTGLDPEVGVSGGPSGSGFVNQIDAFAFPTLRTFTFAISTRF